MDTLECFAYAYPVVQLTCEKVGDISIFYAKLPMSELIKSAQDIPSVGKGDSIWKSVSLKKFYRLIQNLCQKKAGYFHRM